MTILNIEKSARLYYLLLPFIPEVEITDAFDFSSTIVNNIIERNEHEKFLHIATLLTGKKTEEIITMEMNEFLVLFINSLVENRVLDLIEFYRVGLNG